MAEGVLETLPWRRKGLYHRSEISIPVLGKSKWEPSVEKEGREQHALDIKMKDLETRHGVNVNQRTAMDVVE